MDFNIHCESVSHIWPGREYCDINLWDCRYSYVKYRIES